MDDEARRASELSLIENDVAEYVLNNYEEVSVEGDGQCLFRALSVCMYGTQDRHSEIKKELCEYLDTEWDEIYEELGPDALDKAAAINECGDENSQGNDLSLHSASHKYSATIWVNMNGIWRQEGVSGTSPATRTFFLHYTGTGMAGHYNAYRYVKKNDDDTRDESDLAGWQAELSDFGVTESEVRDIVRVATNSASIVGAPVNFGPAGDGLVPVNATDVAITAMKALAVPAISLALQGTTGQTIQQIEEKVTDALMARVKISLSKAKKLWGAIVSRQELNNASTSASAPTVVAASDISPETVKEVVDELLDEDDFYDADDQLPNPIAAPTPDGNPMAANALFPATIAAANLDVLNSSIPGPYATAYSFPNNPVTVDTDTEVTALVQGSPEQSRLFRVLKTLFDAVQPAPNTPATNSLPPAYRDKTVGKPIDVRELLIKMKQPGRPALPKPSAASVYPDERPAITVADLKSLVEGNKALFRPSVLQMPDGAVRAVVPRYIHDSVNHVPVIMPDATMATTSTYVPTFRFPSPEVILDDFVANAAEYGDVFKSLTDVCILPETMEDVEPVTKALQCLSARAALHFTSGFYIEPYSVLSANSTSFGLLRAGAALLETVPDAVDVAALTTNKTSDAIKNAIGKVRLIAVTHEATLNSFVPSSDGKTPSGFVSIPQGETFISASVNATTGTAEFQVSDESGVSQTRTTPVFDDTERAKQATRAAFSGKISFQGQTSGPSLAGDAATMGDAAIPTDVVSKITPLLFKVSGAVLSIGVIATMFICERALKRKWREANSKDDLKTRLSLFADACSRGRDVMRLFEWDGLWTGVSDGAKRTAMDTIRAALPSTCVSASTPKAPETATTVLRSAIADAQALRDKIAKLSRLMKDDFEALYHDT